LSAEGFRRVLAATETLYLLSSAFTAGRLIELAFYNTGDHSTSGFLYCTVIISYLYSRLFY
jgi:hypothetical protein